MNGAGDQFFSGTAFARDDDRRDRRSNGADRFLQLQDRLALANELIQRIPVRSVALECLVLSPHRLFIYSKLHGAVYIAGQVRP